MKKNALVGVAVNFNKDAVKNFILSFREVNQKDDLILFVDSTNLPIFQEVFADKNIKFAQFKYYEFIDTLIHNARYLEYLEFLLDNPQYNNILFADTKDVVFQSNPFDNLHDEFLYFFKEDSGIKIGDDYYNNSWWIYAAYGNEILYKIGYNNIICSGTILGSYNEMIKFLERFKNELLQIKKRDQHIYQNVILDQAIVNYLGHLGLVNEPNIFLKQNGDIIATVGATLNNVDDDRVKSLDTISINGYTRTVAVNNKIPAVVHQYDRDVVLKNMFDEKYQI